MALTFRKLHQHFAAEVSPIELRRVHDPETLAEIRAGMDEHAVLVFRDQPFSDQEHMDFGRRLDGGHARVLRRLVGDPETGGALAPAGRRTAGTLRRTTERQRGLDLGGMAEREGTSQRGGGIAPTVGSHRKE